MTISLPDGKECQLDQGATSADLAQDIGPGLAKAAVAATVDGQDTDLCAELRDGATVQILTADSDAGRRIARDSVSHVMAQAVLQLWPGTKLGGGAPTDDGFYYDFELSDGARLKSEDLQRIEAGMKEIISQGHSFTREEHPAQEASELFGDQPYKQEIIKDGRSDDGDSSSQSAEGDMVVTYRHDPDFVDVCQGPHVPSTKRLGAFKLLRVAGAYWKGDDQKAQLQRVYGTAWESKDALAKHLQRLEEGEQRDHRKLGPELGLFSFPEELGGGLAVWHPNGARMRRVIEDLSRAEHDAAGYESVFTPHLAKSVLWETSGHLDFYADGMYPPMEMEGSTYYPKPMNCPFHVLIYRSERRSFRELPLRIFELGTVYRYERSGVLHGLLRTRGFTQDDSHIFCTRDQLGEELSSLLAFVIRVLEIFGFSEFEAALATRPEGKSVGSDEDWEQATEALRRAIEDADLPYRTDEGDGTFYGPKIDVHVRDAIGRKWQLSTLQVDFQLPQRFEIEYVDNDNEKCRPIMIHRALFGSIERFFGILVEHYGGAFPTWLAPLQASVIPIHRNHQEYAGEVAEKLKGEGFRARVAEANQPLGARVRKAKIDKVPYVLVVGDDDVPAGTIGVNRRGTKEPERAVPVDDFLDRLRSEVASRGAPEGE